LSLRREGPPVLTEAQLARARHVDARAGSPLAPMSFEPGMIGPELATASEAAQAPPSESVPILFMRRAWHEWFGTLPELLIGRPETFLAPCGERLRVQYRFDERRGTEYASFSGTIESRLMFPTVVEPLPGLTMQLTDGRLYLERG
jgi:hypothetical protein